MKQIINILVFLLLVSCGQSNFAQTPVTNSFQSDTVELKETINEEDLPINDYLTGKLKPIRENFKRINSTTNWSSIKTLDLWETTEGGEAKFYYQNGQLEKIVTRNFGEMGQSLTEYYLLDGKLSFVFEKWYKYNRPITWNETIRKENNDTEMFDFDESEIQEDRSYFENEELIHKIESDDCGAPFTKDYLLEEQKRIKVNFDKLIEQTK